jgi:ATP-dependent helicase/nuclease subunit A
MTGSPQQLALIGAAEPRPAPQKHAERDGGQPARTDAQLAAIAERERDVFTEAGAGAGKTGVLVDRYCERVTVDGVSPDRILAFTFTDRAAGELRERARRQLAAEARAAVERGELERGREIARASREGERAWITTIHGFCRRLCAMHPVAARLDPRFRVLDEAETARLGERAFDAALAEAVAGDVSVTAFAAAFSPRRLRGMVQTAHERLRSQGADPVRLPDPGPPVRSVRGEGEDRELTPAETELAREGFAAFTALLGAYDRHYERLKAERSGVDFEDLELRALGLLGRPGAVRDFWRARFDHVMVDEFQDTNRVQLELIDSLRGPQTRLFCVGDEFQSIYRFRHADLEVFRERRREAGEDPDTVELPLRGNFRSHHDVLAGVDFAGAALFGDAFSALEAGLARNGGPHGEGAAVELLLTDATEERSGREEGWRAEAIELAPPPGEGNPAVVAEARALAQRLRVLRDQGVQAAEMVVLLRAFTHVDAFEEALERVGLSPYVVGGRGYWSQQQVEDALRLLAVIANPLDDELLFGALASPACRVSADALWLLRQAARDPEGRPRHVWPTIAEGPLPEALSAPDAQRLARFGEIVAGLRAAAPLLSLDALIDRAISAFDYDLAILALPNGERRMANLRKLMRLAAEYEGHEGRDLRGFLDFAEERTRRDEREGMAAVQVEGHEGVRVMTVHAAKGLEFPVVAVADLGRGLAAGFRHPDIVIGRFTGSVGDPTGARLGMRLPVAAGDSLRLWELVELCEEEERAEVEESLRLVYVAASRAQERLILSGVQRCAPAPDPPDRPGRSSSALDILAGALVKRGWDGEDGEIEIPPAPPVGGEQANGDAVRLAVRTQRPTPERAAELRRRWPGPTPGGDRPLEGASPLLPRPLAVSSAGHLSYSALTAYAGCGYRFYVERVLGLSAPPEAGSEDEPPTEGEPDGDELLHPKLGSRKRALSIGTAVHAALEASARRSWEPPAADELEAILAREGIADDHEARERIVTLTEGWLDSELRRELDRRGARLRAEVPFVLELGDAVVRGKIDLLAQAGEEVFVVDYKTDALDGADPAALAAGYETQRDLYAIAVGEGLARSARTVRAAYCFLEAPGEAVVRRYDASELAAARERLELLVAGIRAGDFTRTERPHLSLCYGCPAAARLCGKPAWRPQWASANGA